MRSGEMHESVILIHVVTQQYSMALQMRKSAFEFKQHVLITVIAVVKEDVDSSQAFK